MRKSPCPPPGADKAPPEPLRDIADGSEPLRLLQEWRALDMSLQSMRASAARSLAAEAELADMLKTLESAQRQLARDMAEAPAANDDDLLAKLLLWETITRAEAEDDDEAAMPEDDPRIGLVLSVAASLRRRRAMGAGNGSAAGDAQGGVPEPAPASRESLNGAIRLPASAPRAGEERQPCRDR